MRDARPAPEGLNHQRNEGFKGHLENRIASLKWAAAVVEQGTAALAPYIVEADTRQAPQTPQAPEAIYAVAAAGVAQEVMPPVGAFPQNANILVIDEGSPARYLDTVTTPQTTPDNVIQGNFGARDADRATGVAAAEANLAQVLGEDRAA